MANVEEVGEVRNVAGGKRIRTVSLNDGEESIRLSLWEEHTDIPIHMNDRLKIECVEVSEWNNVKQLDSTSAMRVEPVVMNDEDKTGQVIALTSDNLELPYELIFECDGTEYEVTVNGQSNIEVNLHHLPTRGILSIRQEGMVMVCVRLRQDDV
ncbi:uncharacterized protein LOC105445259 [Strongylocentrotus purpuratus]|uniref:Uncharacterized protein n=1 Tax=Strongylocentrotus purpuratus TaxID=7668 RepID=A0A7M7NCH0_STRPU|nr:uncharacterized protein LOC105445259 [Strongylocentrotus purpuratus]XP_030833630.1 uncharacterized protein LOC105445259 [Strongylocentrotus purpuratus]